MNKNKILAITVVAIVAVAFFRKKKSPSVSQDTPKIKKSGLPNIGGGGGGIASIPKAIPSTTDNVNNNSPSKAGSAPQKSVANQMANITLGSRGTGAVRNDGISGSNTITSSGGSKVVSGKLGVGASIANNSRPLPIRANPVKSGNTQATTIRFMDFMSVDSDVEMIQDGLL